MNKIKKVLIALDYNPTAQKVAEIGYAFAESMDAEISLLHVISNPIYYATEDYSPIMGFKGYMEMGPIKFDSTEGLTNASQFFLDKTKKHLGNKNIKTIIAEGDIAESILRIAYQQQTDIIVIGSHSQKWLEKILMGSVAEKVIDLTTIPIFVIPTKKIN